MRWIDARTFRVLCFAGALGLSSPVCSGGGGFGGATEITQLLNNGELVAVVAKEAEQVGNQIRQITLAIEQKLTMIRNLQRLPQAAMDAALGPLMRDLAVYRDLYQAVTDVRSSSNEAVAMLRSRGNEMAYMQLSPQEYLRREVALANTRGGQYALSLDRDLRRIEAVAEKSRALDAATRRAGNATGAVQGLSALAAQNALVGGVMMDLTQAVLEERAEAKSRSVEDQARIAVEAERARRELEAREAHQRANQRSVDQFQMQPGRWWQW